MGRVDNIIQKYYKVLYFLFFSVLLLPISRGAGQYWDWTFPLYNEWLGNFFNIASQSWTSQDLGKPLGYSSDFIFRFLVSRISFMQTEWLIFLLMVSIFTLSAIGCFLILKKQSVSNTVSYLMGLFSIVNPAIFYKYNAGHINYLVAYCLLIFLACFLLNKFQKNTRSYVITGLILGVMAIQIQFIAFGFLLAVLFLAIHRDRFYIRGGIIACCLFVCINLLWFTNFIVGANDITAIRNKAAAVSVQSSVRLDYYDVFTFQFSGATQLSKYYSLIEFSLFLAVYLFLFLGLSVKKPLSKTNLTLLCYMVTLIFLSTGVVFRLSNPISSGIGPIFREVGHFAPLISLMATILIATRMVHAGKNLRILCWASFSILIAISSYKFISHAQSVNYSDSRAKFSEFKNFIDNKSDNSRVLTYPFFDQYNFISNPVPKFEGFPIANTGHDSFIKFSGVDYINNAISPDDFKLSVQYRFLQTYDVSILEEYGIKYIFDFSQIYESNYNNYVPPSVYSGDLSTIKNDPNFIEKVMRTNGDRVRLVSPHIIELNGNTNIVKRVENIYRINKDDDTDALIAFLRSQYNEELNYTRDQNLKDFPYLRSVFENASLDDYDTSKLTLSSKVERNNEDPTNKIYLADESSALHYEYDTDSSSLSLFYPSTNEVRLDGQVINPGNSNSRKIIAKMVLNTHKKYYLEVEGKRFELKKAKDARLGLFKPGSTYYITDVDGNKTQVKIEPPQKKYHPSTYRPTLGSNRLTMSNAIGKNIMPDGILENKLHDTGASDCNKYDDNGKIGGFVDYNSRTFGDSSVRLEATRHISCVSALVNDVAPDTSYLLTFDHKALKGTKFGYFIDFNNNEDGVIRNEEKSTSSDWLTTKIIVHTPKNATYIRLYVYSYETDGFSNNVVNYDNTHLHQLHSSPGQVIYIEREPKHSNAGTIQYSNMDRSKRAIKAINQSTNFYLSSAETYNRSWRLSLGNKQINKHMLLNDFKNAWYIDVDTLCKEQGACTQNSDGTYDIELVAEFTPQRWFNIGLVISGTTFAACIGYLTYDFIHSRRKRNYHHKGK